MIDEAGVLGQSVGTKSLEAWKELLHEMSRRESDEIGADECHELVDELERILKSRDDTAAGLGEACETIAGLFVGFRGSLEYGAILERMLSKICMAPGRQACLDILLNSIKIESAENDAHAYLALDVVRMALRRLYLHEDALRGSRCEVLGACYDAMHRAASRNGLRNLAEIMGGSAARMEFCGPGSEICRMAMLRISIYDKRDVPSDGEILGVLRRYPALSGMLDSKRVIESKWRLTRLIHHISLDHLVSHEDYEWAYIAMAESNIRIRYWLDMIYREHGIANNPKQDALYEAARRPSLASTNIMVSARYLALEIYDFWKLYQKNHKMVQDLEIRDAAGIYKIVKEYKDAREMRELRNKFGAHPCWTFDEAARHINAMGLDRFVFYARLVLMFQDAVYRTVPSRHRRARNSGVQEAQISVSFEPVTKSEGRKSREEYANVSVVFKTPKSQDAYITMHESLLCMMLLSINFNEGKERNGDETLEGYLRFSSEVYNVKYMILELANFIKQFDEMNLEMTRGGKAFTPDFLKRREFYLQWRNDYAAHVLEDGVRGIQRLVEENRDLISNILRDIAEADSLVTRLSSEFEGYGGFDINPMTRTEVKLVEGKLDRMRAESNEHYGNEFVDPGQEITIQRRKEEVRRTLGLK